MVVCKIIEFYGTYLRVESSKSAVVYHIYEPFFFKKAFLSSLSMVFCVLLMVFRVLKRYCSLVV